MVPSLLAEQETVGAQAPTRSLLATRIHHVFNTFVDEYRPKTLLDVGTHRGDVLSGMLFAKHVPQVMVGVDFAKESLVAARTMFRGIHREVPHVQTAVTFQEADVRKLPFPNKSFDAVTSHGCMIHMSPDEIEDTLRGIFRVATFGCFVESCNPNMPVRSKPSDEKFKRYWRIRARYYSFKLMTPRLCRVMGDIPYYFSHHYPHLFKKIGAKILSATCLAPETYTWAYVVKGGK